MSDDQMPPPIPSDQATPEVNPYAPPTTDPTPEISTTADAKALRRPLLAHEASIKGIGALIILGGLLMTFTALGSVSVGRQGSPLDAEAVGVMIGIFAVGLVQVGAGWALRRFKTWARIVCSILCGFSLLGFPLGTVIGVYFLYVLLGSKGALIFSDHYQEAMRATPSFKYRTPTWLWIVLGLLILLLIVLVVSETMRA